MLLLLIGFMEIDKRETINYSPAREGARWKPVILGRLEEEKGGNEASLQTGKPG